MKKQNIHTRMIFIFLFCFYFFLTTSTSGGIFVTSESYGGRQSRFF